VSKKLIVNDGTRDRELQLVGRLVVGRDPACDVSHDDSLLSRRHAEFMTAGDEVTVRDLGSRNGVFVNGTRAAEQRLHAGDVVQIGPLRARYVVDQAPISIMPEAMDTERTAVFHRPADGAEVKLPTPAAVPPDEEVTRLIPAPRMTTPSPRRSRAGDDDDDITHFSKAPEFVMPPPPLTAPDTMPVPPVDTMRAPAAGVPRPDLRPFVFVSVLTLAMSIVAASEVVSLMAAGAGVRLALPAAVALLGTYVIAVSINRRVAQALDAVERTGT
jgi:predicted component of type VI protein secretion system